MVVFLNKTVLIAPETRSLRVWRARILKKLTAIQDIPDDLFKADKRTGFFCLVAASGTWLLIS